MSSSRNPVALRLGLTRWWAERRGNTVGSLPEFTNFSLAASPTIEQILWEHLGLKVFAIDHIRLPQFAGKLVSNISVMPLRKPVEGLQRSRCIYRRVLSYLRFVYPSIAFGPQVAARAVSFEKQAVSIEDSSGQGFSNGYFSDTLSYWQVKRLRRLKRLRRQWRLWVRQPALFAYRLARGGLAVWFTRRFESRRRTKEWRNFGWWLRFRRGVLPSRSSCFRYHNDYTIRRPLLWFKKLQFYLWQWRKSSRFWRNRIRRERNQRSSLG